MGDIGNGNQADLMDRLLHLSRMPQLLIACDYDGTIAPIVSDPMTALPLRETSVALRALAALPQTHVAVISSRSLRDLAALSRFPAEIHLVGSHGSEFDVGFALNSETGHGLRTTISEQLMLVAGSFPGTIVESKPASVALHFRDLEEDDAERLVAAVAQGPAQLAGVFTKHARGVVELSVVETNKGTALDTIRHQVGASGVIYLGDDVTDEDAFASLSGPDVGVRVGPGETSAPFRLPDTQAGAKLLAAVLEARSDWLEGSGLVPIEAHSMLSDQRTAAMVTPDARITWMCVPRIDSAAIFAELVGGQTAGYFSISESDGVRPIDQRYLNDSMVLETRWANFTVTDYLDCSGGRPSRTAGRTDLIRVIEAVEGAPNPVASADVGDAAGDPAAPNEVTLEFAPRLDFGRFPTRLVVRDGGLEVSDATDLIVLRAPGIDWHLETDGHHHTAQATVDLSQGPVVLELRCGTADLRDSAISEGDRRAQTSSYWTEWATKLDTCAVASDLVRRSALVLKSLIHGPTGAIVAAPTTSLPEHLGGVRNWDHRYCWLRDAAMSANALVRLGSNDEALAFLDWVLGIIEARDEPERLQPLYLVSGRHLPPEADIGELAGYGGSRPVRVGNAAEHQVQLDVFGSIVELVASLAAQDAPLSAQHWRLVEKMVEAVERRWQEPDHGIWEIRKPPRHHVFSKVMCWVTVDRGITIARGFNGERPEWEELRDRIANDIIENGWNESIGAFGAAYGDDDLDASCLAVGLTGMLAPNDPRFAGTINAIEAELRVGPTVRRYRDDDGLPGIEGGFNLMTAWLIDAYAIAGRLDDAQALFDEFIQLVGPTGLMAEEYDPSTGRALGNHPQAYSHLGLINAGLTLSRMRQG